MESKRTSNTQVVLKSPLGSVTYEIPVDFTYDTSMQTWSEERGHSADRLVPITPNNAYACRGCVFNGGFRNLTTIDRYTYETKIVSAATRCTAEKYAGKVVNTIPVIKKMPGKDCARGLKNLSSNERQK